MYVCMHIHTHILLTLIFLNTSIIRICDAGFGHYPINLKSNLTEARNKFFFFFY